MLEENNQDIKFVKIVPPPGENQVIITDWDNPGIEITIVDENTIIKKDTIKEISKVKPKDLAIRNEVVHEILTSAPHWMIRWGNILFLFLVLMVLFLSWIIKYPDIAQDEISIKNIYPKERIIQKGNINTHEILVENNQFVNANTPLIIKKNNANTKHVLLLSKVLDTVVITSNSIQFPFNALTNLSLGDIQASFAQFQYDYQAFKNNTHNKEMFKNSILSYEGLKKTIEVWNENYIVSSSISGTIKIENVINELKNNATILEIIPKENDIYVGRIKTNKYDFEKVKKGHQVYISLSVYPEYENGVILGFVSAVFWDNSTNNYTIEVELPEGLLTTYGVKVNPETNLNGIAKIIVQDRRLIERFIKL